MFANTRKVLVAATALATVTWLAAPVAAQRGRGGDRGSSSQAQGQQGGNPRSGGERRAAQPRQEMPREQAPAPQREQAQAPQRAQGPRPEARPQPQAQPPQRAQGARPQQVQPQQQQQGQRYGGGGAQPRQYVPQSQPQQTQRYGGAQPRQVAPSQVQRPSEQRYAVPRQVQPNRPGSSQSYRGPSNSYVYRPSQGYHTQRYYSQPSWAVHSYVVRRPVFVQPYYAFRPRLTLSFGFHVGYGFSYPFSYWDPYAFYNYNLGIRPGYTNYSTYYNRVGGVSFEIDPYDAEVYVDGDFIGYASDFGPEQMPLTLLSGRHHVELCAPGYQDVSFDITVVAGQVIPYQGTLPFGYDR